MADQDSGAKLSFELHTAARLMRRNFDRRAREHELSRARWQVMWVLAREQGLKQAELAERLDMAPISLGRQLDNLEQEGLVERRRDACDRRCFRIHLTDAAQPALKVLKALADQTRAEALAVAAWCFYDGTTVDTENAYIKADKLSLAAEVSGVVTEVLVRENQPVKAGEVLVVLDDYSYRLAVAEAEAHLAQVKNQLSAKRADHAEARAALEQANQDAEFYQRQLRRNEKLGSVAVSEAQLDESRQLLAQARSRIAITGQKLSSLSAELGGDPGAPMEEQADLRVAQAQLDRARYQLTRTQIIAPVDGIVANNVPQVGELAHNGLTLVSLLSSESLWVEANLKETQLANIRPGQPATVEVDAYPGVIWQAEVDSLSPASGSEFALIPAQNASGNWVKVVQRIPVRLRLLPTEGNPPLRSGMSAEVWIDTQGAAKPSLADAVGRPVAGQPVASRPAQ